MSHFTLPARRAALVTGCGSLALSAAVGAAHAGNLINKDSLLVSMTTYQDVGQVFGLIPGVCPIPAGAANANGNVNNVWNNSSVDGQFGVTSPLQFQDLSATTGALLAATSLDPSQVVASFSSKSELGLSITSTKNGPVATVMAYTQAGAGYPSTAAGMLDVSNANNPYYNDQTNAASQFYKGSYTDYAFNRSVIAVSADGSFTVTPTKAYGGDNSRAAVLAPNGLYYTGREFQQRHDHRAQLTHNTGLEVVTPGSTPNSTMIDPSFNTYPTYQNYSKDKAERPTTTAA